MLLVSPEFQPAVCDSAAVRYALLASVAVFYVVEEDVGPAVSREAEGVSRATYARSPWRSGVEQRWPAGECALCACVSFEENGHKRLFALSKRELRQSRAYNMPELRQSRAVVTAPSLSPSKKTM